MGFFTYIGIIIVFYYLVYLVLLFRVDSDVALAIAEKFGKKLNKLKGKTVWITDASNKLGSAVAHEVAANGGKLILSGSRANELIIIKQKCLELNAFLTPADIMVVAMDITKTETHKSCFKSVLNHFGSIDILINNIGKCRRAAWEDVNIEVDHEIFKDNVFGVISLSRIAVQFFLSKGKGHIAVMSGLAGIIGVPYFSPYAASLHALHGYFESLRSEKLGKSLQISLLCSGLCNLPSETGASIPWKCGKLIAEDSALLSERFARLAMVAIVNKLDEAWMGPRPIIPLAYAFTNFPNFVKKAAKIIISLKLS